MPTLRTLEQIEQEHTNRAVAKGLITKEQAAKSMSSPNQKSKTRPEQDDEDDYQDAFDNERDDDRDDFEDSQDDYDDNESDDDQYDDDDDENEEVLRLKRELESLKQDHNALQNRVAPAQRGFEEYRNLYQSEHQERERERQQLNSDIEALRKQLEDKQSDFDLRDVFSEEELEMRDVEELEMFKRLADEVAKRRAPKTDVRQEIESFRREQEARELEDYRKKVLLDRNRRLVELRELGDDPKFIAWTKEKDNDDFDDMVDHLLKAPSKEAVDRYARHVEKRIAQYKGEPTKKQKRRSTDAPTTNASLDRSMRRRPKQQNFKEAEAELQTAIRLARSSNSADRAKAKAIMDKHDKR